MTLNSGSPDFVPPDPALVLMTVLAPTDVVRVLDALRGAGCLRETTADWPAADAGALIQQEVRVTQWLPSNDRMLEGDTIARYGMAVSDGISIDSLLGVLTIAEDDVLAQLRERRSE